MNPVQYRNHKPLEYLPNDFRIALKSRRFYTRSFIFRRKRRKLPGIFVGSVGLAFLLISELIKGGIGLRLFGAAAALVAAGAHFEMINRIVRQYKYFVVPGAVLAVLLIYLVRPQIFNPILPKQFVSRLAGFSSGFDFSSNKITLLFGIKKRSAATYTRKQLQDNNDDSLYISGRRIPLKIYLDKGKLFLDADVFAGADASPIRIRRDVIYGLPYGWDGNYTKNALEIVSADTLPVFQFVFISRDSVLVRGVFTAGTGLVIVDESGILDAKGKRVLFYGTQAIFKYPSWKHRGSPASVSAWAGIVRQGTISVNHPSPPQKK